MSNAKDCLASKWKNSSSDAKKSTKKSSQTVNIFDSKTRIIFEELQRILVEQLGIEPDEVWIDSNFIEDLGADSLDIVELGMAVEETFNIEIPDEKAETMKTVRDVVNYINSQL